MPWMIHAFAVLEEPKDDVEEEDDDDDDESEEQIAMTQTRGISEGWMDELSD